MQVFFSDNPLQNFFGKCAHTVPNGLSANSVLAHLGISPKRPIILIVDSKAWGRSLWDDPLPVDAQVTFLSFPRGIPAVIVAAVGVIGGLIVSLISRRKLAGISEQKEDISKFSGGWNKLRTDEPFPEHFGRLKIYPDLIQHTYVSYYNNSQFLFFAGVIGVGEYDVENVYIDNTPLTDYNDCSYHITGPGEISPPVSPLTLVPFIVWTSGEVDGQVLTTDWITFIVSAPFTNISAISYDIEFPQGLSSNVTVNTESRRVDGDGNALTSWVELEEYTCTDTGGNPIYITRKVSVNAGSGRYQFRIKRADDDDNASLTGLRGIGDLHDDYGDVTLVTCIIKASDQLVTDAASKINVIATRKLGAVTDTGIGETLVATRSIVDAVAYLITAPNCGNQTPDMVDWEELAALRDELENSDENYRFDYRFTSKISVMDAVAMAAACCKAIPCMPGGMFTLKQDVSSDIPSCLFTHDNIRNMTITATPHTTDDHTSVKVTYTDNETWESETVLCYDEDSDSNFDPEENANSVDLYGCTDRQQAYEVGMYLYWREKLERVTVEFSTGMSGYIPQVMDKVLVINELTGWGTSGIIMAVNGLELWLSEPVDFRGESAGLIYITLPDGSTGGPYTVESSENEHCVIMDSDFSPDTFDSDGLQAARFLFGVEADYALMVRVGSIKPQGRESVTITGTIIDDSVYNDPGSVPPIGGDFGGSPLLFDLDLEYYGSDSDFSSDSSSDSDSDSDFFYYYFSATWDGNASKYKIELDEGGGFIEIDQVEGEWSYDFPTTATEITVKVTPWDGSDWDTDLAMTADGEVTS